MDNKKWYENKTLVYVLLVIFFPVGLYGLWKNTEISKNVKIVLSGILAVIVLIGLFSGDKDKKGDTSNQSNTSKEEKKEDTEKKYKIGDKIPTKKFEITVLSAQTRTSVGGQYFNQKASDGGLFIAITIQFKNTTKEPLSSFSNPSFKLIDSNGVKYDSDAGASAHFATEANITKKIISDLNPGISVKDAAVFEVSQELWNKKGWKLEIDAGDDFVVSIN